MIIKYLEGTNIETRHLNNLFNAVGWRHREERKWKEVFSKSHFVYTAWDETKDETKLVGMARIVEDGVMCMFYDICVHPDYQRKGIGSRILKELINRTKDKEYRSIGLFAWEENPANIKFYEKFGFVRTSGMELAKQNKLPP